MTTTRAAPTRPHPAPRVVPGRTRRPPTTRAGLLELQRSAGNRAVAALVGLQRAGGPPVAPAPAPPATAFRPVADFDTLTVSAFNAYANERPDWAADPALPTARRGTLRAVLEFARDGAPPPLAPMGDMPVRDVETHGLATDARTKLRDYARAVRSEDTVGADRTAAITTAIGIGETVATLEAKIPKAKLHHTMGSTDYGRTSFRDLQASGEVAAFADYFGTSGAYLEAENGMDVDSYLLGAAESPRPEAFVGTLPHVRNYHRFQAALLNQLVTNEADTSKSKPLLLILHTGTDHNGAFHRDDQLTALVEHPRNLTIMVEGALSLDALGGEATRIARTYGQGGRIQQLMLAGHGLPRAMDLAGSPDRPGSTERGALDLDGNRRRTEAFLRRIIDRMDTGPDARIVLNACLTAADEVSRDLPADPARARRAILRSLARSPSLTARIVAMAPGRTVEGNVSSVPAGRYMHEDVHGTPTGVLHQQIPSDEYAGTSNRADYVEHGQEAEGAMRAVVALWAVDKAELMRRIDARLALAITARWSDRVIHTLYDLVKANPDNAQLMNRIANHVAYGLGELRQQEEQHPNNLWGLHSQLTLAEAESLLTPLHPHAEAGGQLAMDQVWMVRQAARRTPFMTELDAFATTQAFDQHLRAPWIAASATALLPTASATTPTSAQMKLALWGLLSGGRIQGAVDFLTANASGSGRLTMPGGATVEGLTGGSSSEDEVLTDLGLRAAPAPGSTATTTTPPNLDTDGDGVNDLYVESITITGLVTASRLNVRQQPSLSATVVGRLPRAEQVEAFGRVGRWYAIHHGGGVAFVHRSWVRQRAVA